MGWFGRKKKLKPPTNGVDAPETAAEAVRDVVDQLVIHHPFTWSQIETTVGVVSGVLRVEQHDVVLEPGGDEPPPHFFDDDPLRVALLGEAIARLATVLFRDGTPWVGPSVSCQRKGDVFSLVAAGPDGPVFTGSEIRGEELLMPPAILAELGELAPRIKVTNDKLEGLVGEHRNKVWDREEAPHELRFDLDDGSTLVLPAAILGSYSQPMSSWCWAWANASFSGETSREARGLRDGLEGALGHGPLVRPGFPSTQPFSWTVAHLAAQRLGDRAFFCWPVQGGAVHLFFALDVSAS